MAVTYLLINILINFLFVLNIATHSYGALLGKKKQILMTKRFDVFSQV